MAQALQAYIASKSEILLQLEPTDTKFQVEGVAPTIHSSSQKTRPNNLPYGIGIKIWTDLFHFISIQAFVRQTDTFVIAIGRVGIPCSAEKN